MTTVSTPQSQRPSAGVTLLIPGDSGRRHGSTSVRISPLITSQLRPRIGCDLSSFANSDTMRGVTYQKTGFGWNREREKGSYASGKELK